MLLTKEEVTNHGTLTSHVFTPNHQELNSTGPTKSLRTGKDSSSPLWNVEP